MINEIGSDYWLTDKDYQNALLCEPIVSLPYSFKKVVLTSLCRTGIELFLDKIDKSNGVAFVPEFTCHSVVRPFANHGYDVHGYKLKSDLSIDVEYLGGLVSKYEPDVIIIHSYFGFNTIPKNIREVISDTVIIEDLTQRLFSSFPLTEADSYVGSIRKWMPIPDGGFYAGDTNIDEPVVEDSSFTKHELDAFLCKGKYMIGENIEKNVFREAFASARQMLKKGYHPYTMSKLSRQLYNSFDLKHWKSIRQKNARYLVEHLNEFDFLDLPLSNVDEQTVPFMIPVFVKERRKEFQSFLAKNDIYATIIWTCPEELQNELTDVGRYIYDHILCFHCDQRYNLEDMERIYNVIKLFNDNLYE